MTPTQRTLKALRDQGMTCDVVERFIRRAGQPHGVRRDLFHVVDILAMSEDRGFVGVQCFGASGFSEHWRKVTEEYRENTRMWLRCGGRLELWGWRKLKVKRGGKAVRWHPRIVEVTLVDIEELTNGAA